MKNPAGKSRKPDSPYLTITLGTWRWKVLKFWQADGRKDYGRAFCAVASPFTYGVGDLGDVYVSDLRDAIRQGATVDVDGNLLDLDQAATLLGLDQMP